MLTAAYSTFKPFRKATSFLLWAIIHWLFVLQAAQANELPNLGSSDLVEYTKEKEQALGRAFKSALHTEYRVVTDPDIENYIRRIGHQIAQHTGDNRNFSFYVIENPDINAFAGPDGVIGIHTGLITSVRTEAELASVIAHEIAHVTQNHLSRRFELQSNSSITTIASIIAAILIGMQDSSAGMATLMGSMGADAQQQLKYSRAHESEADSAGISYLYKSGYNPYAMGDFFGRLSLAYQNSEFKPIEILQTHPVTEHRLAEARNRAQNYPPLIFKQDEESLTLIKLKLQSMSGQEDQSLLSTKLNKSEQCYADTLNLLKRSPLQLHKNSLSCLYDTIKSRPTQRLYQTLLYEVFLNPDVKDVPENIIKQAEFTHELYPQDPSALLRLTQLLIKDKKSEKAINLLEKETPDLQYQNQAYKLLSTTFAQENKMAAAYYYEALSYFNIGDVKRTNIYLNKAKNLTNSNETNILSKINHFESEHAKALKENNKDD
ncbi:M48 family metalloprotease [Thiomicrorhabdus sp.]|uniref:M48 family metalloprotease n=1 Tax=Thiomicrorhabdus sp. TaxID=2039724 RepID=UPI0035637A9F